MQEFVSGLERFTPAIAGVAGRMDGTPDALRVVEHRLAHPVTAV